MPRKRRVKSEIDIYHVVLRGINQQVIFEDDEDFEKLLQTISYIKTLSGLELFAYCIMKNHCHFLIKVGSEGLDQIFRRFGPRYVRWYNTKYKRVGHLFQNRFWSEAIKNDRHFFAVLRYIHQNPIKAGMCSISSAYQWSSYNEYVDVNRIVDVDYVLGLTSVDEFISLHNIESSDKFLDNDETRYHLTDAEARNIIKQICNCNSVSEFQNLSPLSQKLYVQRIKGVGVSIRQTSRLTGVSKGIIERI